MLLTDEQKRANKVQRVLERFRGQSIGKCLAETARLFQKHVRLSSIERDGKLTCCSCGKRDYPGRHFDAGHWISRRKAATALDKRNCHPQCVACNRFDSTGKSKHGYDAFMRECYGQEVMDELVRLSNTSRQFTRDELAEMYVGFLETMPKG